LAREAGLDLAHFTRSINSGAARAAVLAEGKLGKEQFNVRGTPTLMVSDGTKLRHPIAYPRLQNGKIISIGRLPCSGEGCYTATRALFDAALEHSIATQ
ncbi:MAG: hypothetical protein KBD67_09155, partial [Anaerolineaceae bacterium]|nr:hypothetical protein [Anaerolineaceae bacterium]